MSEARYDGLNWGTEQETTGLACLQNFDPAYYKNAATKPKWVADTGEVLACGMLKALLDAHRLVWAAQLRFDIRTGRITVEAAPSFVELLSGVPNPIGSQETRAKVREFAAGDAALADVPALYDLVCFEVLQAVRSSRPIKEPQPIGSSLAAIQAQLGALPAVVLIALGVAAIAGITYIGTTEKSEMAKAWQAIEIEKAWAVNRAWAEVEIAKQQIATGQPYVMSDWARTRAGIASASQSSYGPLVLGGALAAVIGASAYLLREKPTAHHANPAHFVPRRRRIRRKKNATKPTAPKRKRNAAPKRKRNAAPKRKRKAAPKRKRNAAQKRKKNPGTVSHTRVPASFVRSQHAKGRSTAQAQAAWKLGHKKRSAKGRRGKR